MPNNKILRTRCPDCLKDIHVWKRDLLAGKGFGSCPYCDVFVKVKEVHKIKAEKTQESKNLYEQHKVKIS